jgi:hypothetical protein
VDVNNYRPISILHVINKFFEKLILKRMTSFINRHNLLSKNQYGFVKNSSTMHAALHLIQHISSSFTLKHYNISMFIDFSKAFDTVSLKRLLSKLWRYGFRGIPHDFLRSYLSSRQQYVKVGESSSPPLPVAHGVPQGSCLAPLLFNLYINDINFLPLNSHILQFADDTVFTLTHSSLDALSGYSNEDMKVIYDWCCFNQLSLNIRKTQPMLFTTRENVIPPELKINHTTLNLVSNYKYLGLEIDNKLKYDVHLKSLATKLSQVAGATYSLGKLVSISTAKSIYYSLAQSHISYMIPLWGASAQTRIDAIQVQQNKIIRNLFRHRFPLLSTTELFSSQKILKVSELYHLELSKLMFYVFNSTKYQYLNNTIDKLNWNHNYNTRKIDMYRLPFARILPDYNSFLFQGIKLWNELPIEIRSSTSFFSFKKLVLLHNLSKYNTILT